MARCLGRLVAVVYVTVLLMVVVVALLGVLLPRQLVGSGVDGFEGRERRMAEGALGDIAFHGRPSLSLEPAPPTIVRWRVTAVGKCPGTPSGRRFEQMIKLLGGYRAEVRAYGLFGIPRGEAVIACQGDPDWEPYF